LLAVVVAAVAIGVRSRAADPPQPDHVDDLRAAFQKDIDRKIWFRSFELPSLDKTVKELEGDTDKKVELDEARKKYQTAKDELTEALDERAKDLPLRLKDQLAKTDNVGRVALANIIGDEAERIPYPDKDKLFALVPNYLALLHPEVPVLVELTEAGPSHPLEVRQAAALALGKTKGDPAIVVPALAKLLRDQKNPVPLRLAAAEALIKPIEDFKALSPVGQAGQTGPKIDASNVERLKLILQDNSARAWPVLVDGLGDSSPAVRMAAASSAKEISAAFLERARGVLSTAGFVQEYGGLLKAFKDDMPKLAKAIESNDPALRQLALSILDDLATALTTTRQPEIMPKPSAGAGLPRSPLLVQNELPVALPDLPANGALPARVAQPVGEDSILASALKASLPAMVDALKSSDVETRRSAAFVVEAVGGDAAPYIPQLVSRLSDPDRFVRWTLLRTLGQLAPKESKVVVPKIIPTLRDPDIDVRLAALKALERFGKDAGAAGPTIVTLLPNGDPEIQLAALKAIQASGGDSSTLGAVADLLETAEPNVRVSAAETLGKAGKRAVGVLPKLERAMSDEDEKVRSAASEAVLRVKQ
jgi:HEAT repeat protein